jgi:hypothetical protein
MAAAASLTIPVSLVTPLQTYNTKQVLNRIPGASHIAVDAAAGKVTFQFEFPGNIDRVMDKLRARHVTTAPTLAISVPVENLTGKIVDREDLLHVLNSSPTVQGARFDGTSITATISAQTNAMRYMYEEIINAGLMPLDVRTRARPQDFVL